MMFELLIEIAHCNYFLQTVKRNNILKFFLIGSVCHENELNLSIPFVSRLVFLLAV